MTISREDSIGPPRFNSVLGGWLEQKLGISITPPDEDDVADWGLDEFVEWIERSLKVFPVPPSLQCASGLVRVPQTSKLRHSVTPRLLHAGALGLYRWQNASVLADLNAIKAMDGCPDPLDSFVAGRDIDEPKGAPPGEAERFLVTDADFSQAQVVWKARTAEGLVMHGPPGTGKSQTIVNVIADALARGERVLMVCQKDAATRVVHNRLRQAGLDELCLEVHDAENDRLSVFRAIRDQVSSLPDRAKPQPRDRARLAGEIEALERELDDFAIAMRQPDPAIGLCYRDLLALEGRAIQRFPEARVLPNLPRAIEMLGHEPARSFGATLRRLGTLFHAARVPWNSWTSRVPDVEHQIGFRRDAEQALSAVRTAGEPLEETVRELQERHPSGIVPPIEGDPTSWRQGLERILDRCRDLIERSPQDREAIRGWLRSLDQPGSAERYSAMLARISEAMGAVEASDACPRDPSWSATLHGASPERVQIALASCRRVVASTKESWLRRWLSRSLKRAKQVLQALRSDAADALLIEVAQSGSRHADALELEAAVLQAAESCHPTLGQRLDDPDAAKVLVRRVHATAAEAFALHEDLRHAPMLRGMVDEVLKGRPLSPADVAMVDAHRRRADSVTACLSAIETLAWLFSPEAIDRLRKEARTGGRVRAWADRAIEDLDRIDALAAWEAEARTADAAWQPVIEALTAWGREQWSEVTESTHWGERWEMVFLVSMAKGWKSRLLAKHPVLVKVNPTQHEAMTTRLGELIAEKRRLETRAIVAGWSARQLESKRRCPWEAVFKLRAGRNGPSPRLREAIGNSAHQGLFDMRPCWLTNPAAVSQIFPRLEGLFDLVIFDEASQCPVELAIPTIFRGKRVLIAGDMKQLPPTSFFSSSGDDEVEAEQDAAAEDEPVKQGDARAMAKVRSEAVAQSIDLLEAAVGSLPQTYLQVHYRSEHPALIQFSNHAFYNGLLEAPPTATPKDTLAPIVFKDAGGIYAARTNREEAKLVVEEIASLITQPSPPTIGVVTFNVPQRDLVEDLLEERADRDPVFRDAYEREKAREDRDLDVGLFVKNLENVQGDERDVMIFSTTFGRDGERQFYRRFGPVGQVGGERRLNVAVTRAKRRVIVLTSMPLMAIAPVLGDLGGSGDLAPAGYLQLYLDYARSISSGDRAQTDRILGRLGRRRGDQTFEGPESPFEEEVLQALQRLGIEAEPQVGDGGFRIDIAIPHKDRTRGYALAIECDGAAYHSDRSARIRDVWRQDILEQRGWRFHRIWSRSWWDNPAREVERLAEAVQAAIEG
jgi:primosomal replication protein N''